MALVTKTLAVLAGGQVVFQLDYDDALLRLQAVRCINNSASAASGAARSTSNGRSYSATFPAGQTTTLNIPTGAQNRLNITIDARGRVDGVDYSFGWPA